MKSWGTELRNFPYIAHGRSPIFISTGVSVIPCNWNADVERCISPCAKSKNEELTLALTKAISRIQDLKRDGKFDTLTNAEIKYYLEKGEMPQEKKPSKPSFGEIYRKVMSVKTISNQRLFLSTLRKLEQYTDIDKVMFEDINKLWLDGFCATMSSLGENTKSIHLRNIRTVINYAIDCGITANYPFLRYRIPHAQTRKRSFTVEVLRKIATAELDDYLSKYRDLFMLSFYLIGINVVDLCNLKEIKCGRVEYVRAKTHKPYSIKVEPEALEIIERLKGENFLIYALERHSTYRTFYMQWDRALGRIRDILDIPELTSYWARHSWATIASSLDIPKDTIAHGLGHGGNTVTDIYIDFDMDKVDEANRRIIDYVLYDKR